MSSSSRDFVINILASRAQAKKELDQFGNDISGVLGKGKKQFSSFSKFAGGVLTAIGGAAAISGIASFVSDSVQAAQEAEASQQRLTNAYAQFPAVGDVAIGTLRDLNSELALKTRFDDDATASGQAVLAQFKLTGKQIQELTPLLQDYAAKTGKDLPTAAQDLGKAMLGQGRSLKAIGIDFVDTGSAAGNFDQIMSGLRQQVGGFAESEGKTAAGQAAILANQFGEVQEQIGAALMPALLELSGFMLGDVVPAMQDTVTWLTENWSWLSATGTAVGGLVAAYALYRGGLAAYATVTGIVTAAQAAYTAASYGSVGASYASAAATGAQALAARGAAAAQWLFGGSLATTALRAGVTGVALGGLAAVITILATKQAEMSAGAQEFRTTLDEQTGAVTANTRAMVAKKLADAGAFEGARLTGVSQKELTDALLEGGDALDAVQLKMAKANGTIENMFNPAVGNARNTVRELGVQLDQSRQDHVDLAAATENTATATDTAAGSATTAAEAYADASGEVDDLATGLSQLVDAINKANGVNQDAVAANSSYQTALAGINDELVRQQEEYEKANGTLDGFTQSLDSTSLDQHTASGAANASMLADVAGKAQDAALAQLEVDRTTVGADQAALNYQGTLAAQRQAFIDSATQAGYNADEVQKLADKVFAMPSEKDVDFLVNTMSAGEQIDRFIYANNGRQIRLQVYADGMSSLSFPSGMTALSRATGGWIAGPGTSTSDSIPAWLSDGEFVVKESVASKNKGLLEWINSGGLIPAFAGGGHVGSMSRSSSTVPMVALSARPLSRTAMEPLASYPDELRRGYESANNSTPLIIEAHGEAAALLDLIDLRIQGDNSRQVLVQRQGKRRFT